MEESEICGNISITLRYCFKGRETRSDKWKGGGANTPSSSMTHTHAYSHTHAYAHTEWHCHPMEATPQICTNLKFGSSHIIVWLLSWQDRPLSTDWNVTFQVRCSIYWLLELREGKGKGSLQSLIIYESSAGWCMYVGMVHSLPSNHFWPKIFILVCGVWFIHYLATIS